MIGLEHVCLLSRTVQRFQTTSLRDPVRTCLPNNEQPRWHSAIVDDLGEVEEMLDQLESDGHSHCHLCLLDSMQFQITWK